MESIISWMVTIPKGTNLLSTYHFPWQLSACYSFGRCYIYCLRIKNYIVCYYICSSKIKRKGFDFYEHIV